MLLNLDTESHFGLDAVGARMWGALASSTSIDAAFEELAGEYDVDAGTLRTDLLALIDLLVDRGLIELQGER